jgi:beta-galactosidase
MRSIGSRYLVLALMGLTLTANAPGGSYLWIEGESPTKSNARDLHNAWPHELLSGGRWLEISAKGNALNKAPDQSVLLTYAFETNRAEKRQIWARVGYEMLRTPFQWQLDDGPWHDVAPDDWTTNLSFLRNWVTLGWLKLSQTDLGAGKHEIRFRLRPAKLGNAQQIRFALDAICIAESFQPHGLYKPDADWRTQRDRKAGDHVFQFTQKHLPRGRDLGQDFGRDSDGANPGKATPLSLAGDWEIAQYNVPGLVENRTGPMELPDTDKLFWSAIQVPGDRNELRKDLAGAHRFLYRTRVAVPASAKDHRLLLGFEQTSLIVTVFVNGKQVGYQDLPFVPWNCDITEGVKFGQTNEIVIGVKDWVYAYAPEVSGENTRYNFHMPMSMSGGAPVDYAFRTIGGFQAGLIGPVTLRARGPVYTSDVFVVTKTDDMTIEPITTIENPSGKDVTVKVAHYVVEPGQKLRTLASGQVAVPAGRSALWRKKVQWQGARLWWPDDPHQYELLTIIEADGAYDVHTQKFGFRQWTIRGTKFYLNGVAQQLRADLVHYGYDQEDVNRGLALDKVFADWRENGQNMFRFRFQPRWGGMYDQAMIDQFDSRGIHMRRNVARLDGQVFNTAIWYTDPQTGEKGVNKHLMRNWRRQAVARVKAERNHPSIFVWELDNESIMLWGMSKSIRIGATPAFRKVAEAILEVDPTRSVMTAGGMALNDDSLPIYGVHYFSSDPRRYPDEAYWLEYSTQRSVQRRGFPMELGTKPIFMSEEYYTSGKPDSWFAAVAGESVFTGMQAVRDAQDLLGSMLSQGYRWHGVAAFHYWGKFGSHTYKSWQPVAAFTREWNYTFAEDSQVVRTVKIFNDTRHDEPIEFGWQFVLAGRTVIGDHMLLKIPPGQASVKTIRFKVPGVEQRTAGKLVLTCSRDGKKVFEEAKELWVLNGDDAPVGLTAEQLVVLDPQGQASGFLRDRNVPFTPIDKLGQIPAGMKVLLVGKDAIDEKSSSSLVFKRLAAEGKRVVVLEQSTAFTRRALPAELEPAELEGRIAFANVPDHPVMTGLGQEDFFTWAGDHVVYRNPYRKAQSGAISLVQCDQGLDYTALVLCPVNDGMMVLSQLVLAQKLSTEPAAGKLLLNLLRFAGSYAQSSSPAGVVVSDPRKRAALDAVALSYTQGDDPIALMKTGRYPVLVVEATPENLSRLARNAEALEAYTNRGNWIMLWGLEPEGLETFNKIVGVDHLIRPFRLERVLKRPGGDALMTGVASSDLQMNTPHKFHRHTGLTFLDWNVFSYVVDYDDIAPFATWPEPSYFGSASQAGDYLKGMDHLPTNMVNNLTQNDYWVYRFAMHLDEGDPTSWDIDLPRRETINRFSIVPNRSMHQIEKIKLIFDGDEDSAMTFDLPDEPGRQDFYVPNRKAKKIRFEIVDYQQHGTINVLSIDNVWLGVERSQDFRQKVKPLLNIGALVKYPKGDGGILLNQIKLVETESTPVNTEKKLKLLSALLRNLGAAFDTGRVIVTGMDLEYHPVLMKDYVNVFLDADHNWPDKDNDLSLLPIGEQKFKGVSYDVYEYKTALFPHAVMLRGSAQSTGGRELPEKVRVKVDRKADAVFFLHAALENQKYRPPRRRRNDPPAKPPVLFTYFIRYQDGQVQAVDVRLDEGVGLLTDKPRPLDKASVAWTGKAGAGSRRDATVYQMVWTNPRPQAPIESIEFTHGPHGNTYAHPVLLGITTAVQR